MMTDRFVVLFMMAGALGAPAFFSAAPDLCSFAPVSCHLAAIIDRQGGSHDCRRGRTGCQDYG